MRGFAGTLLVLTAAAVAVVVVLADPSDNHDGYFIGQVQRHKQRVVCYMGSWSVYRSGAGKFNIEDIDANLCNHIIYAFVGIEEDTHKVKSLDPYFDINQKGFERFVSLKKQNPDLDVTFAIGGYTEGSEKFSAMAANPSLRRVFIDSLVSFIKEHNFDGVDLDWEYPALRGGVPEDKRNFVILVKEIRQEFNKYNWLLTAVLGVKTNIIDSGYNVKMLACFLDYIHVATYNYNGKWSGKTGHVAPLYARDGESGNEKTLNVEYSINYFLDLGCPREKLVMGVPLYGRSFLLQDPSKTQFGAPAKPTAFEGPYTGEDGFIGYNEICEIQTTETGVWYAEQQKDNTSPYMYRESKWISYDDHNSLHIKAAFAQKKGLAGMMVWSLDTDDFKGTCFNNTFPLLRAINNGLRNERDQRPVQVLQGDKFKDHCHDDNYFNYVVQTAASTSGTGRSSYVGPVLTLLTPLVYILRYHFI